MEISNYIRNKIVRRTFLLYSSVILNIFLGWVIAKLNTSYLSIDEFGQYTFFIAVIYFLLPFFTFGVFESNSRLLAFQEDKIEKRKYFGVTFISAIILSIPLFLFLLLFALFADNIFKVDIAFLLKQNFYLIGFLILQSFLLLSLRGAGKIKILSLYTFSPRFFYIVLLGFLIFFGNYSLSNTIYSLFAGLIFSTIIILFILKPLFGELKQKFINIYRETKKYGIHLYLSNIMSETLSHADKILISYFLNSESMAYYGLAYMLTFPLSHFSKSLATTLYSKFANENLIHPKIIKSNLLFISITVFVFILFREFIIVNLFSEKYMPAVNLMLPLALAFGFSGLSKPYTHYLMVKGFGKIVRNISITVPVSNILLNLILIPEFGINGAAWAAFFSYGLDLALYWYYYSKEAKGN